MLAVGGIDVDDFVVTFAIDFVSLSFDTGSDLAQLRILSFVLQLYPYIAGLGSARGIDCFDEVGMDGVADVETVQVANNDDRALIELLHDVIAQLYPFAATRLTILQIRTVVHVVSVAGIHVHIVDHQPTARGEGELIAAETLRHHLVQGVAELAEIGVPERATD